MSGAGPGVAVRVYGWLLRLLPARLRSSGEEMRELFEWQRGRVKGRRARARFVWAAFSDVVKQALAVRLSRATSSGGGTPGRRPSAFEPIVREGRIAVRNLVRQPGFALPVIATLGLGVGLATAMAVVVQGVLLRPLPYPSGDRLVVVRERVESGRLLPASYANFRDWREGTSAFSALAAVVGPQNTIVLGGAEAARVPALFVSADYFRVAGIEPEYGRVLSATENSPGGAPAVVVSHRFWMESLGGRADLDAVTLAIQDLLGRIDAYAVVGVLPAGFDLMGAADVYVPLDRAVPWSVRGNHVVHVVGRMAMAATAVSAAAELDRVQAGIRAAFGAETEAVGVGVTTLRDEVTGSVRTPVLLLLIGALLLLATAFLNTSGALLARGVVRQREFRVRVSLGATRRRLLFQLVLESAVFAVAGLVAGILLARALIGLLSSVAPAQIPRLAGIGATWSELLVAGSAFVTVGLLLFGIATAALATRGGSTALRTRGTGTTHGARVVWTSLIATEAALALALLSTAGVLGRSLWGIANADTGFESRGIITAEVNLPPRPGADASEIVRYFETALEELRSIPGVESAGVSNLLPLPGPSNIGSAVQLESGELSDLVAQYRVADAEFFPTLGIRLERGRLFDARDVAGAAHSVVINTTMADALFPNADPIGRRFHLGGMDPYREDWLTIIGVVEEARPWTAQAGTYPVYYVDFRQRPVFLAFTGADLVVKSRDANVAAAVRDRLSALDADVPVRVQALDERMATRTADRRFVLALLALFALLALALTAVGIWGVVSFVASRRTRDMAIRLALGASPGHVLRGLQWETGPPVLIGCAAGAVAAVALTRLVRSQLYGVGVFDPASLVAVAVTLIATAWCASWLPARRARRLDPAVTLRDS